MLTIDIKLNGRTIAQADLTNLSGLADVSAYDLLWDEDAAPDLCIPESQGRALIKDHNRRQSVWALVAKAVVVILGQMAVPVTPASMPLTPPIVRG